MKKAIFLIIAVLSISVLSGCIDNKTGDKSNVNTDVKTGNNTSWTAVESELKREADNASKELINSMNLTGKSTETLSAGSGWCTPGSKIMVNLSSGEKEYTITGLTTYNGREVCRAEMNYENGTSIKYFSKDGKYEAMISNASGPVSVYSEASTKINSSG